ncbi:hypothetical protein V1264_008272 [Littorina saxatilis]|uniref:Uncharacterized protein n=1 Tax=Littorina saxatilis TaxID=31220 RepID=A0AAN9ATA9_9CAEN
MACSKRFAEFTQEELLSKRNKLNPENTKRANEGAAKILREYLNQRKENVNFESYTLEQLDEVLGHFYLGARTMQGEMY